MDLKKEYNSKKYIMVIHPEVVETEVSRDTNDILEALSQKSNESSKRILKIAKETQRISEIFEKLGSVERDVGFITQKNQKEIKK